MRSRALAFTALLVLGACASAPVVVTPAGSPGSSTVRSASTPGVVVPDLVGRDPLHAMAILKDAGLGVRMTVETTDSDCVVTRQTPEGGSVVPPGSVVRFVVSAR